MPRILRRSERERVGLRALAMRDRERHAKVAQRMTGTKLSTCLIEVISHDRQQWQCRDECQEHDVCRAVRTVACDPRDEIDRRERAEHTGPTEIRNEQRIPCTEPGAQRRRYSGTCIHGWCKRRGHRFTVRETPRGIALETTVDRCCECRWKSRRNTSDTRRRLRRLPHHERGQVRRIEREFAAHCEIADDAERVDVAPSVDRLVHGLLGAHEVRRAHHHAGIGDGPRLTATVRDTKIGHECSARARFEQDVVRFDVAVHDAAAVRIGECPCDFAHDARGISGR